jgi:hypothetical protein
MPFKMPFKGLSRKTQRRDDAVGNVRTSQPISKPLLIVNQAESPASSCPPDAQTSPGTQPSPGEQTGPSGQRPADTQSPHGDQQPPGAQASPAGKSTPAGDLVPVAPLKEQLFPKQQIYGLRVLHSPPKPLFDIIFVHGLTGNSFDTWLDSKSNTYWPVDLLSTDIQDARILAFGYDADVTKFIGPVGQNNIREHASSLSKGLADLRADDASVSSFSTNTRHAPHYRSSKHFIVDLR